MSGEELRQLARVQVEKDVEITFDNYRSFSIEYAENLSEGGMFLRTTQPVAANTTLHFRLKIKDIDKEIAGSAIVVWTKEIPGGEGDKASGMGLKFIELEGDSANFIREFINRHAVTEH